MSIFIITVSLIVLIYLSFILKIPKVSIPLGIIYSVFILNYLIKGINEIKSPTSSSSLNLNEDITEEVEDLNNNAKYKNNIKPRPLIIPEVKKKRRIEKNQKVKKIIEKEIKTNKIPPKPYVTTLTMRDMQICRNVKNRNPIGTDTYFENTVDSLFCYTRVQNTGGKQELTHIWYFEDQKIGTVRYNIKTSNIYRSWTRKTILPKQIGTWRVEVQDTAGVIIGSEFFYITNPKNQ